MKRLGLALAFAAIGCGMEPDDQPIDVIGSGLALQNGGTFVIRQNGYCWNIENADTTAGAYAQLFWCHGRAPATNEQFNIARAFPNSNIYTIKPVNSGLCLSPSQTNDPSVGGYSARQWPCNTDWHRYINQWYIDFSSVAQGDYSFTFRSYADPSKGYVGAALQGTTPNRLAMPGRGAGNFQLYDLNGNMVTSR